MELLIIVILILCILNLFFTYKSKNNNFEKSFSEIKYIIENYEKKLNRIEIMVNDGFIKNREEENKNSRDTRGELNNSFKWLGEAVLNRMSEIANLQKNQLDIFANQINNLTTTIENKLNKMRETLELQLQVIQNDNNEKLEKIRTTVDEKLHKALEERMSESFKQVSERLELVHKGLGEMQSLATGVGDLKKVLSNVKTRGILGELQLESILEQILTAEQYSKNVITKPGSKDNVEFAIKLPGNNDISQVVWIPIDSKFPLENYNKLIDAYEKSDLALIDESKKNLENNIKKFAKDIRDKYIDPPNTTDFGIMFLPVEGLYAEVVRRTELIEILQRNYKIIITGPTTLAAFLNSLQMGFRTLIIEKRSGEIWKLLGAIKTEFGKFGIFLDQTQQKLEEAGNKIKEASKRSKAIERNLNNVEKLPENEARELLSYDEKNQNT